MSTAYPRENTAQLETDLVPASAPMKSEMPDEESEPLIDRLHRAFGPLAGAMILDTADFVTFGPIGLILGLFVGVSVAWWISSIYEYERNTRIFWAAVAGLYCMMPLTAFMPLATLMSTVGRFREKA